MTDLDVVTVGNGELQLAFLPDVGGRLISLQANGFEVLWRNPRYLRADLSNALPRTSWPVPDGTMASWTNVGGSKTWPAPQGWAGAGEWPGPPDAVLDAGSYSAEVTHSAEATRVRLTSAPDRRTGLQITRSFVLPRAGSSFHQENTFVNVSQQPVRWSIWEVTQIDTALGGTVTIDGEGDAVRLLDVVGEPRWAAVADGIAVPAQDVVAKLGFPGASGRLAWHRSDGVLLEQTTTVSAESTYPDGGCRAELWLQCPIAAPLPRFGGLHPDAHLIEMELLSPLVQLAPGETTRQSITWRVSTP